MTVNYNDAQQYLHATISGRLDTEAADRVLKEMNAAIDRFRCKLILYDLTQAEIALDTHEIYQIPQIFIDSGNQNVKRAVIFPNEFEHDFTFFETVAANKGVPVQTFTSPDAALDWLLA